MTTTGYGWMYGLGQVHGVQPALARGKTVWARGEKPDVPGVDEDEAMMPEFGVTGGFGKCACQTKRFGKHFLHRIQRRRDIITRRLQRLHDPIARPRRNDGTTLRPAFKSKTHRFHGPSDAFTRIGDIGRIEQHEGADANPVGSRSE